MKTKKVVRTVLIILVALIVGAIGGFFVFRNSILNQVIAKISEKADNEYHSDFKVGKSGFSGFSEVDLEDVTLVPHYADTLFAVKEIRTDVNFWKLFSLELQLNSLSVKNGYLQLVKKDSIKNFDAYLPKRTVTDTIDDDNDDEKPNYAELAYNTLTKFLNLVPADIQLQNLALKLNDNGKKAKVGLGQLRLKDKNIETILQVNTNTFEQRWKIAGYADPRYKQMDVRFFNLDSGKIKVPYFDERYNLKGAFDSIRVKVSKVEMDGDELHIDGFTSIIGLLVNHPKIASKDVVVDDANINYRLRFGESFIAMDSSSTAVVNGLKVVPFVKYGKEDGKSYELRAKISRTKAQTFINALPEGLFTHFEGMEANGEFEYELDFKYNKKHPNAIVFDSKLRKYNLAITKYGEANLNKLNGSFVYRAIDHGVLQRPLYVGSSNPNYAPLETISPYVQKSVLTTEDPSFFRHRGFINQAFKQSIVQNIKTKKFSRGASTISMQLVKNVFLTREKTLSRKLEEILLVYIMENNQIVSKSRMMEVYLNIIEWGPNIYGIGEASRFYFQKGPGQLSLNESLYLASIIPRPKGFMYQFDSTGDLRSGALRQQSNLTNLMLRRGVLSTEDTIQKSLPVFISGPARNYIKIKVDPSVIDTLNLDEFVF